MNNTLVIIPAAGFGTRMNLQPDQSKEMLPDPGNDNKPLIQWSLDLTKDYSQIVMTRTGKQDLITYLNTAITFVEPGSEWPVTVLESQEHWQDKNLLILPDTRFQPTNIIQQMEEQLDTHDLVFACHEVPDVRLWGKVLLDPFSKKPLQTQEKADIEFKLEGLAWGLIGFKKHVGEALFQSYANKKIFNLSKIKTCVINLSNFKDITRTGQIESHD